MADVRNSRIEHPLRTWLDRSGVSTTQLAKLAGLQGRQAVHRILRQGSCSPATAARIEAATGGEVRAVELLYANRRRWRLVPASERCALMVEPVG